MPSEWQIVCASCSGLWLSSWELWHGWLWCGIGWSCLLWLLNKALLWSAETWLWSKARSCHLGIGLLNLPATHIGAPTLYAVAANKAAALQIEAQDDVLAYLKWVLVNGVVEEVKEHLAWVLIEGLQDVLLLAPIVT